MITEGPNQKAVAWDHIGSLFWQAGRRTARPSDEEIDLLTSGVPAGARCVVVGASTKELVDALVARGVLLTVLDFSARMCADLRASQPHNGCTVRQHDITHAVPEDLCGTQDYVLSERLINRFSDAEAVIGLAGMAGLLCDGGQIRTAVKLGLYPMDERMIALGRARGCLTRFYDEANRAIDYAVAGDILRDALLPHGDIPTELLLLWYRGRGKEKRFEHHEIVRLFDSVSVRGRVLQLDSWTEFPTAPATRLYVGSLESTYNGT